MDPVTFLMLRMSSATLLLAGTLVLLNRPRLRIDRRGFFLATGTGLVNGIGFLSYFKALAIIEASVGAMIFSLSPLAVLGLLALRGEPLSRRHWIRLALGLGGVYLLIGPNGQVDVAGAFMVILAVITFAIYLVLSQWFLKDYHPQTVTFYVILGITISSLGGWLLEGGQWRTPNRQEWAAVIVLAMVSTYLARLTLFGAVRLLGSGQIAMLAPLDTLLSIFWALVILGERLAPIQLVGGAAILASMLLAIQRLQKTPRQPRWRLWSRL
jgi:drug/metabolite transporter (DMT)-like permease